MLFLFLQQPYHVLIDNLSKDERTFWDTGAPFIAIIVSIIALIITSVFNYLQLKSSEKNSQSQIENANKLFKETLKANSEQIKQDNILKLRKDWINTFIVETAKLLEILNLSQDTFTHLKEEEQKELIRKFVYAKNVVTFLGLPKQSGFIKIEKHLNNIHDFLYQLKKKNISKVTQENIDELERHLSLELHNDMMKDGMSINVYYLRLEIQDLIREEWKNILNGEQ